MRTVQLGECALVVNGFAFKSDLFTTERQGLPIIRIRDVIRGRSETYYTGDYPSSAIIQNGDLLIGMDGEFNIARWQGGRALLNQRVCKLEALSDKSDTSYLRYALPVILKRIEDRTPFVTVKHLSSEDLKEEPIPLPKLSEQKRIARLLEQADRLRHTRLYALELSNTFLAAAFLEYFGNLLTNENRWISTSLNDVTTQITDGEHITPKRTLEGIKLLSARNIKNGFIDLSPGVDFVPESEFMRIRKRCWPQKGDILMSCSGSIGRVTLVSTDEPLSLVRSVALIRPNPDRVVSKYLEHYLRSSYMQTMINRSANQSSQANIFNEPIKALPCLLPPIDKQKHFAALAMRHERLFANQREALRQADHLFQTLLHNVFTFDQ